MTPAKDAPHYFTILTAAGYQGVYSTREQAEAEKGDDGQVVKVHGTPRPGAGS